MKKIGPLGAQLYAEVEQAFEHTEALTREIDCDYERTGQLYLAHSRHTQPSFRSSAANCKACIS